MAGFNVLYANEFVEEAQRTYILNHKDTLLDCRDIRTVTAKDILKRTGLKEKELDVFEGSPPCSAFSAAGSQSSGWGEEKMYSDGKVQVVDDLFFEYVRLLQGLKPKVFVAENVKGLTQGSAKGYLRLIAEALKASGYKLAMRIIDASYFGVPQARERLIFVGVRNDIEFAPVHPDKRREQTTVQSVFPEFAKIKYRIGGTIGDRVAYVPSDRPFPTITARDHSTTERAKFSAGGWIETVEGVQRKMTIPELKRAFGFPDDFILTGDYQQRWERLGRSVPPPMMAGVMQTIRESILDPYYKAKGLTPMTSDDWIKRLPEDRKDRVIQPHPELLKKSKFRLGEEHDVPHRPSQMSMKSRSRGEAPSLNKRKKDA